MLIRCMPTPLIIDTDPGIDDALALLLALSSPEVRVEAVTIVGGNVGLERCVRNALLTIEASGAREPPPVAAGAAGPLVGQAVDAAHVHGDDGLGGASDRWPAPKLEPTSVPAVELMLETIKRRPGRVTLVALGPLTNLAIAFRFAPEVFSRVGRIVVMGGSLAYGGNTTPAAEYNFYADPEAARVVVRSGLPVTLVGLDATSEVLLEREPFERRAAASSRTAAQFARDILGTYFDIAESGRGKGGCYLHDPLAVGAAIDPSLVKTEAFHADVETAGELTRGALVADRRLTTRRRSPGGSVEIAVEADAARFVELFVSRICG